MEELTTGGDERIAFGTMAKGQKKYGSTASNLKRTESEQNAFVYNVQRGDTLQGLSVKFGITTEQIRRTNQLWTNDSLFLRDKLLIPWVSVTTNSTNGGSSSCSSSTSTTYVNGNHQDVQPSSSVPSFSETHQELNGSHGQSAGGGSICSSQESPSSSKHWTHPLSDSFESEDCALSPPHNLARLQNTEDFGPSWSNSVVHPQNGVSSAQGNSTVSPQESPKKRCPLKDHSEKSAQDFLSRIDNAIASSRHNVKNSAEESGSNGNKQWVTFESDSESDHNQRSSVRGTATALRTEGRHLRYSLRKLEQAQDELFQL